MKIKILLFTLLLASGISAQSVLDPMPREIPPHERPEEKPDSVLFNESAVPTEERTIEPMVTGIYFVNVPDSVRIFDEGALGFYYQKVIGNPNINSGDYDFVVMVQDDPIKLEYVLPSGERGFLDFEPLDGSKVRLILLQNGRTILCPDMDCSMKSVVVE